MLLCSSGERIMGHGQRGSRSEEHSCGGAVVMECIRYIVSCHIAAMGFVSFLAPYAFCSFATLEVSSMLPIKPNELEPNQITPKQNKTKQYVNPATLWRTSKLQRPVCMQTTSEYQTLR